MKYFTYDEINKHKTKEDCWLVAGHNVYNVTNFLKLHPLHEERIMKHICTDVKVHFNFHTKRQQKEWEKYFIGKTVDAKDNCSIQ